MRLLGPDDAVVEVSLLGIELLADGAIKTPEGVFHVAVARDGDAVWVSWNGRSARFERVRGGAVSREKEVRAPMTGRVVAVTVAPGERVQAGQVLAILEAMKMEYRLEAPEDGVVDLVDAAPGALVELGQTLVKLV